MKRSKFIIGFLVFSFLLSVISETNTIGRSTVIQEGNSLSSTQEEPTLFLKVSAMEEIDFADTITFAVTGNRMDKVELVELAYIHAELRPKGEDILLAVAETGDFVIHDNNLYVSSFPPLNTAGEYQITVTASWHTSWDTYVNASAVTYFNIAHWRDISQIGEEYLDELDRKANEIIYGINLLETGGDDILSIMTTRIACMDILQKALTVWATLPPLFHFTIINLDGFNRIGVTTDRNTTVLEQEFNQSVGKLSELDQEYSVTYIRNITQLQELFTTTVNYTASVFNTIIMNLHGSFLPIPESFSGLTKYPIWIDMLRNSTQLGQWIWVNLGRGTPLRYITWYNSTSGSYTFRPIDNVRLLTYFYQVYQASLEEDYVPDVQKTFHTRTWKYLHLNNYGGVGNGEGWSEDYGFNNREMEEARTSSGIAIFVKDWRDNQRLENVGDFTFALFPLGQATTTDKYTWSGESPTFTFNDVEFLRDMTIKYRSYDIFNYKPENAGAWQDLIDDERGGPIAHNEYPISSQGLNMNSTVIVRYRTSDDLNTLRSMSWTEIVLEDGWMNYTRFRSSWADSVSWWCPNPYGLGDQINYSNFLGYEKGWNDFMISSRGASGYIGNRDYGYPSFPWLSKGSTPAYGTFFSPLKEFYNYKIIDIGEFSATSKIHIQFNITVSYDFDGALNLSAMTFDTIDDSNIYVGDKTPFVDWINFGFDKAAPSSFAFVDQVPDTLPLNFTVTEGTFAPNNTEALKSELADYTEGLLNVALPNEINTSYAYHLPTHYDVRKFYFTWQGEVALGMKIAQGSMFVHSVVDGRTTTLCVIGGIWKAYEEAVTDTIDDLTKIFYKTQYDYPLIANESTYLKWGLINAWQDKNLSRVRKVLFDCVVLANDTFHLYQDPLEATFNFTFAISQINISAAVEDLGEAAEATQAQIQEEALRAASELNNTLDQIHITDTLVTTLQWAFGIMAGAFFTGAVLAAISGGFFGWGTAIAFGILGGTAISAAVGITALGDILMEWETNLITTIKVVVSEALTFVVGEVNRAIATSIELITDIVKELEYRINVVIKDLNEKLNDFAQKVRDAITAVLQLVVRIRSEVLTFIKDTLRLIKDFFILALTSLLEGVTNLADTIGVISENLQKSVAYIPQLAGSVVRTVTQAARNSEFVTYILDTLGITDQAFELAENVANAISNSRMADVGLGIVIANPMVEKDTPSTIYILGLSYGDLYDLSALSINITNSETFYYEYGYNITRIAKGIYKLAAEIPEGQYTLSANFLGSAEAYATERVTAGRTYFLADISLAVTLETDKETYNSGDTINLKIWTTNLMYSYNYITVEIRLIDDFTNLEVLREERIGIFINAEETKMTFVHIEIPWYILPADYKLQVELIEESGERETATYSIRIQWGLFTWIACWHPGLIINGFPIALIVWVLIGFSIGRWGATKLYRKVRPKQEETRIPALLRRKRTTEEL